jgi:hypothetical protein
MLLASTYDQSKYFKAADVTADKKLRIKDVTVEELGVGKDTEKKLCVWFTNDARGLVLNKINNRTLRGAFGDACDGWKGKIVVVFPTEDARPHGPSVTGAYPAAEASCCRQRSDNCGRGYSGVSAAYAGQGQTARSGRSRSRAERRSELLTKSDGGRVV